MVQEGDIKNAEFTHVSHGVLDFEIATIQVSEEPQFNDDGEPVLDDDGNLVTTTVNEMVWMPHRLTLLDDEFTEFVEAHKDAIKPCVQIAEIAEAIYLDEAETQLRFKRRLEGEDNLTPSSVTRPSNTDTLANALQNELFERIVREAGEVAPYAPPIFDDVAAKAEAKVAVENLAESYRQRFIAQKPGKQATYEIKAALAKQVLADRENPPEEALVVLSLEAEARDLTVIELAELISSRVAVAEKAAGIIEASEVRAKTAIDALPNDETLEAALEALAEDFARQAEEQYQALMAETAA